MEKPSISFFAMIFILLFVAISLILIVFDMHRLVFVFELGVSVVFMFFMIFAMFAVYHGKNWGWTIIVASIVLLLADLFFVFFLTGTFDTIHIAISSFSAVGLILALLNLRGTAQETGGSEAENHGKAKDYYPYIDKMEPEGLKAEEPSIEKTFTPGKFIASKKAGKFHSPKCDWAKKISKSNQIWFDSREAAEAQGLEADQCVG